MGKLRGTLAWVLAWILPPNAVSVRLREGNSEYEAKCLIFSTRHFQRECSRRARDHFVRGRISQQIFLAWSRDAASEQAVLASVEEACERTYEWLRVFLPDRFDVATYCRCMLDVSLRYELRTEGSGYAEMLFAAQRNALISTYEAVLQRYERRGAVVREADEYRVVRSAGALVRLKVHTFFRFSKLRAALRLLKHPFLYEGWVEYLVQKVDRSTGTKVELTERERRWPLIFLWPRAVRFLLQRQPKVRQ